MRQVLVNCCDSLNELLLSNNAIGDGGAPHLVRLFEEMKVASRHDGSTSFVARQEHADEWARTASGNLINNTAAIVRPVRYHTASLVSGPCTVNCVFKTLKR